MLWTGGKLPLLLFLWFFFLALPRVRFIIIIDMTGGKVLVFILLLSDFYRPRMVHFLMILFFKENKIRLCCVFLDILHIHLRI
jgi:hypothetical protein